MFEMMPFKNTFGHLRKHGDYFDNLFDNFFSNPLMSTVDWKGKPFKVDVKETENAFIIEADLPGVKKEGIGVEYENNYLTISARTEEGKEEEKENYLHRERYYGEFQRSFYVDNIKKDGIEAAFNDGVLKVTLPKQNPEQEKKKIDVK